MSKKILKRSLALGALMAFVITGSAMAAEVYIDHEKHADWSKSENIYIFGEEGLQNNVELNSGYVHYGPTEWETQYVPVKECNHENCDKFDYDTSVPEYPDTYVFKLNDKTLTVNGDIHTKNDFLEITGTDNSALYLVGGSLAVSAKEYDVSKNKGTVNIGTLNIKNGSLGVSGASMTVTAKTVYIENSSTGINVQPDSENKGGNLTVTTDSLTVKSGHRALRAAYEGGLLNVEAGNVEITSTKASGASYGATLNLTATNEGSISSDFFAGEVENGIKKGTVKLTLGKGIEWTGKVITEATGTGENASVGSVDLSGTWNLKDVSTDLQGESNSLTNATFNSGSTFIIDGETFEKSTDKYALNGVGDKASLTVVNGAKIVISGGEVEGVYNVAKDFATNQGANWTLQADNALWYVDWTDLDEDSNTLQGKILTKTADDLVDTGIATGENKDVLLAVAGAEEGTNPTADAINELASNGNVSNEDIQKGAAALLQIGEAGGFTGNVVSVGKQVNNVVGARNSFAGPKHGGPRHRGGHGPSVADENNGGAVWAQYVHGKDKVDGIDMGGVENAYESQFNGVVLGMDFKQVGSYASGITFNYGEGDSHSKKNVVQSDSEFDFWGVGYYGAVKKQDTNFIFDIGYSESDSDVEQVVGGNTITANPEASTWTAGVKVEKLIDKGAVQIVPYAGLRYMSIDTDDYKATGASDKATYYSTERQDIWLLPIGVSMSQENVYDSGWIVTPRADLSYTWAMGDTDSSMTVNMPGVGSDNLGYTVMDDGSFMATVGLDAQKEDWTFGVAYSYQKGDSTRSDRWYVNARYSF